MAAADFIPVRWPLLLDEMERDAAGHEVETWAYPLDEAARGLRCSPYLSRPIRPLSEVLADRKAAIDVTPPLRNWPSNAEFEAEDQAHVARMALARQLADSLSGTIPTRLDYLKRAAVNLARADDQNTIGMQRHFAGIAVVELFCAGERALSDELRHGSDHPASIRDIAGKVDALIAAESDGGN